MSDQGRCPSPSCVSLKSDKSRDYPLEFKQSHQGRFPSPSCMSLKSDKSRDYPLEFKQSDSGRSSSPSCMSLKSDRSRDYPLEFKQSDQGRCPSPSCVSLKSDKSRDYPLEFKQSHQERSPSPSCMSLKSDKSRDYPLEFKQSDPGRSSSPSCMSLKSDKSRDYPLEFKQSDQGRCPSPSCVSLKSDKSRDYPLEFKQSDQGRCPSPSGVSLISDKSRDHPLEFKQSHQGRSPSPSCVSLKRALELKQSDPGGFPSPSCMSLKSDKSRDYPLQFKQSDQGRCPSPSGVSLKSDKSRDYPLQFKQSDQGRCPSPSGVSLKSDKSRDYPLQFKQSDQERCPSPSCVSLKSDKSRDYPLQFKQSYQQTSEYFTVPQTKLDSIFKALEENIAAFMRIELKNFKRLLQRDYNKTFMSPEEAADEKRNSKDAFLSIVLKFLRRMKNGEVVCSLLNSLIMCQCEVKEQAHLSRNYRLSAEHGSPIRTESVHQKPSEEFSTHQINLSAIFKMLEEDVLNFAKNELKTFHNILSLDYPESFENQEVVTSEEENENINLKKNFLKITLEFMRNMKQEELGNALQNKGVVTICQHTLKTNLKNRLAFVFEGINKAGNPTLLSQIYTDLYITEGNPTGVNCKHEVKLIEKAFLKSVKPEITIRREDIFKSSSGSDKPIRTVMTEGVAGIGKTVLTKKFTLDWAEGKIYQNFQFIFPFSFRELNMLMRKKFSLVELIHLFFPGMKEAGICSFEEFIVLFIFDGLDECRLPLNLKTNEILTDATEPTTLEVMLTNLLEGKLLPAAHIWITTRPAAAHQIPPEFIDLVTEVRGFNDPQKEEYFRKRFTEEEESRRVISHIKATRSIFIMCHIPVFCWITATVLEEEFRTKQKRDLPKSLTEMYIYFLFVLSKVKNLKYDGRTDIDPVWTQETKEMIQALGRLAFQQLMKGNLFFYESDLTECGIDVRAASVYSGVFTEIFQEEKGLFNENVFCFVHLSIQEFLAALHVHLTFTNTGVNLLAEEQSTSTTFEDFYQFAVDKALQSPHGQLDLLLRFLMGLSQETSQTLLHGLITENRKRSSSSQNTVQYIQMKIVNINCIFKKNNLFQCLNELRDCSLIEEMKAIRRPGRLPADQLPPAKWAALVNIILSSAEKLDEFYLNNYFESDNALLGLLNVIVISTKAVLSCCNLTEMSCSGLTIGLQSHCLLLKELDLSNNDLKDSGVKLMCEGLRSPQCTLESLSLSGCLITKEGCAELMSSLKFNFCHLKELDLSYNHPEESGVKHLSAGLEDSKWALQTLRVEPMGSQFLKPGLRKYACELMLDPNTAHRNLILSENNRKVTMAGEKQSFPDHPEMFDVLEQLLCTDGLTGRCYWEVEWRGSVHIAAAYKRIKRKGESDDCTLGKNEESWSLLCSDDGHSGLHKNKLMPIQGAPSSRVGVYLDWPGGILTFFGVSSGKLKHLQTFNAKFTEPVYPAFRITSEPLNSSLFLSYM
ncbi:uncharacterized protein LOC105920449 [Fundulus heteroclitus]|uniref:uncharacterized protein LOC105920449 n=1 Tax=Fundulus heteroclitus TaxID=8078 RepID=UPI00165B5BD1|nr:uncharacterized protein LOC105920449 [Fundulus heteroclitus]